MNKIGMFLVLMTAVFANANTVIFDRPEELSCEKRMSITGYYFVGILRNGKTVYEGRGMGSSSVAEADLAKCEYIIKLARQQSKYLIMDRELNWGHDNFLTLVDSKNDVFSLTQKISELENRVKILEEK